MDFHIDEPCPDCGEEKLRWQAYRHAMICDACERETSIEALIEEIEILRNFITKKDKT